MKNIKFLLTLALSLCSCALMAQTRIMGHVTSAEGPIVMANVVEKDANNRNVSATQTDANGNISQRQSISGINEIVDTFENTGAEEETLIETGTNRLLEMISKKSFTASIKKTDIELFIGDIVTGQDYITGVKVTKPIINKIAKRSNGTISMDYKIEGGAT